jgi:hypothetical protein
MLRIRGIYANDLLEKGRRTRISSSVGTVST